MSDVPNNIVVRIKKLLNLATSNPNEAEASSAMEKAQALLAEYNLSFDAVNNMTLGSGARERQAIDTGFYDYQRYLWKSVAHLNFCIAWSQQAWNKEIQKYKWQTYVVGKKVNIASTIAMATYLDETATRMAHKRTRGENETQRLSRWANSYRDGLVARICRRLRERRNEAVAAEEARAANIARQADNASTARAVTLSHYVDAEHDANIDFIYGEGTSAAWAAKEKANTAARQRVAERKKLQQQMYTAWSLSHPEEAKAMEAERLAELRKRPKGRTSKGKAYNGDNSAYWAGYDDGENVSIDPQINTKRRVLLR